MAISINDRLELGKYAFDIQTEVRGSKIVGEILSSGKVLKRLEKRCSEDCVEESRRLHASLKRLLVSRFVEKSKGSEGKALFSEELLKKELLSFLELEEERLRLFYFRRGSLKLLSSFGSKSLKVDPEEIFGAFEEEGIESFLSGSLRTLTLFLETEEGEDFLLFLLKGEGVKLALGVSGVKLGILRRKLAQSYEPLTEIVERAVKR
ncbi:hypothetical protein [Thermovibrio sp.]